MHHPWRQFRHLAEWTLLFADLPGRTLGLCNWADKTITLRRDLLQAQRRSVIAHEVVHVERGPFPGHLQPREEREVSKEAARRLVDIRALGEAMAWSENLDEIADELWVDRDTVLTRLAHLHPAERAYLKRRLDDE